MADAARVIIVHTLDHATAAFAAAAELNISLTLQSPPDAIYYAGSLYFLHLFTQGGQYHPGVPAICIIDCADAGAQAINAIAIGHKHLRSSAPAEIRAKLADIAAQSGATLHKQTYEALDLLRVPDTKGACMNWLREK